MTFTNLLGAAKAFLLLIGGVATVRFAIGWVANEWASRGHQKRDHAHEDAITETQHRQQKQIEELRSSLKDRQDLFGAAISIGAATHGVSRERSLRALEDLWVSHLSIREMVYWPLVDLQPNLPLAWDAQDRERRAGLFREKGGWRAILKQVESTRHAVERSRPFFGERLWQLFWVYNLFVGYGITSADSTIAKSSDGPQVLAWHEREPEARAYLSVLKEVIPTVDEDEIFARKASGFRMVLDLVEREMLSEMQLLLSGTAATRAQIQDAQRLADAFAKLSAGGLAIE